MVGFARRLGYGDNHGFDPLCPLCGKYLEDEEHAWRCSRTIRDAVRLRDQLISWVEDHLYLGKPGARVLEDEADTPACMVVWAVATKTQGVISDKIGTADWDSLGTQFLLKAVAASARLWQIRFKLRDKEIRRRHGMIMAAYVKSFRGRDRGGGADSEEESGEDEPPVDLGGQDSHGTPYDGALAAHSPWPMPCPHCASMVGGST